MPQGPRVQVSARQESASATRMPAARANASPSSVAPTLPYRKVFSAGTGSALAGLR